MTPWENTFVRRMIYLTLFGTGAYADKRVAIPGHGELLDMDGLVVIYLRRGQRHFEKKYRDYPILETEWFQNFMKYHQPFPAIRDYLYDRNKAPDGRGVFLDRIMLAVREYSVFDTRQVLATEEKLLRDYFGVLISIVGNILKASPKAARAGAAHHFSLPGGTEAGDDGPRASVEAYLCTLASQEGCLALAQEFLGLGGRDDWDRDTVQDYPEDALQGRYGLRLLRMEYFNAMGNQTFREWTEGLAGEQWEHEVAYYFMQWLRRHENSDIPASVRQFITQYYNRNISGTDFCPEHFSCRQGIRVAAMIYFATRFSLEVPESQSGYLLFLCKYPPAQGRAWLPAVHMTEAKLRSRIAGNLKAGIVSDTALGWHILYCMDHPDESYTETIARVARNQLRKKWVRQLAMKYTCSRMDVDTACERILPRMQGDMFFFVAEQYRRAGSARLVNMVWRYGEKYATHKLHCDVMLVHLQNRSGMESLLNHIEKRHLMPPKCREYGITEAIRNIDAPELLDGLERFLSLGLKDSFKDDGQDSMLDAALDALVRMASSGAEEYAAVREMLGRYLRQYRDSSWKKEKLEESLRRIGSGCAAGKGA